MDYSFNEAHLLIIKLTADPSTFTADAAMFSTRHPRSRLNYNIVTFNDLTKLHVHQCIIRELLKECTVEEIEENRNKLAFVSPGKNKTTAEKTIATTETEKEEQKERLSKYKEFPNIQWKKTDDEMVSLCILLYNERIEAYRITQELQPQLAEHPKLSVKIVEAESRHYEAQQELINFNKVGKFLHKHTIIKEHFKNKKLLQDLYELKRNNPDAFSKAVSNAMKNVSRYKCEAERATTDTERENAERLLQKAQSKLTLLQTILANG